MQPAVDLGPVNENPPIRLSPKKLDLNDLSPEDWATLHAEIENEKALIRQMKDPKTLIN